MRAKKTVTSKKLAANRANAKKSKGPQTERGKNASKFNATIWGLFGKHVVIPLCDGNGSEVEFERLRADLRQEYQPEGPFEAFCVAQVAESMWKLRRATRHEKGSVGTSINVEDNPILDVLTKAKRLAARADILKKAEGEIKTTGTLSEATYGAVLPLLSTTDIARAEERKRHAEPKIDDQFVASLEKWRHIYDDESKFWMGNQERIEDNYSGGHSLPPEAEMDKNLRCRKAAQKDLDWALQRLLESQQRRKKTPNTLPPT